MPAQEGEAREKREEHEESTTTTSPGILVMEMREQDGRGRHFQSDRVERTQTTC